MLLHAMRELHTFTSLPIPPPLPLPLACLLLLPPRGVWCDRQVNHGVAFWENRYKVQACIILMHIATVQYHPEHCNWYHSLPLISWRGVEGPICHLGGGEERVCRIDIAHCTLKAAEGTFVHGGLRNGIASEQASEVWIGAL